MAGFSISGIASGIDTQSYIDAIIKFERQPAALMEQDQAEKTNIVSTLSALQAKILALKTKALQLTRAATFEKGSVTVSDDSILSAKATGRVSTGSYDVQVLSLARNHQIASQGVADESSAIFGTGTITIGVGATSAKTITIDSGNNSLVGIKKAINDADSGVTATIIDDGSESNPYRLVLTSNTSGFANKIKVSSSLAGGQALNVSTASFDSPETIVKDSSSDAVLSLGASAAYTGNENKIYTFTVTGDGSQTVGSDNITVDWTDGTNSGSIIFTQADSEVELVGTGADGLKLSLSAGQLAAGDTFQVQSFSPLLQDASDARIAIGSSGGTGSPITVTSQSNTFDSVIGGLSLTLRKETAPGDYVTINTDLDVSGIRDAINEFITSYNDVMSYIDDQNSYNEATKEAGILLGDGVVQALQYSVRRVLSNRVTGLSSGFNQLATIGIRTDFNGKLAIKDSAQFEKALRENLDDVINLFANSGSTSTQYLEFVSAGSDTKIGDAYKVDITQAATQGTYVGNAVKDLANTPITLNSSNNRLKIKVNNIESSDLILTEKTYDSTDELVSEIQQKIDADSKIGSRGLKVEWVSTGSDIGHLQFTSATYGKGSKVEMVTSVSSSALAVLALAGGVGIEGKDVAGTINGEEATGQGQYLTGADDNATTAGLKIKVTYAADQLVSGAEGEVSLSKGVASSLDALLDSITKTSDGLLSRRIKSYQDQITDIQGRIDQFDARLALRRETLQLQFQKMEETLAQLNSTGEYLSGQLAQIQANWSAISKSSSN